MRRTGLACLAVAALAGSHAVAAEEIRFQVTNAGDLAALCSAAPAEPTYVAAIHFCHGFLIGVHHIHSDIAAATERSVYCLPPEGGPTRDQAAAGFAAWAAANPVKATELDAAEGLLTWAAEAYPCPK